MLAFFNRVILLTLMVGTSSCLLNDNQVELKGFGTKYPDRLEIEGFRIYNFNSSDPNEFDNKLSSTQVFDFELDEDKKVVGIIWPGDPLISEFILGTSNQQIIKTNVNYNNNLIAGISHINGNGAVVKKLDFIYEEGHLTKILTSMGTLAVKDSINNLLDRTYVHRTITKSTNIQENLIVLFNEVSNESSIYLADANEFDESDIDSLYLYYNNSSGEEIYSGCDYFYSSVQPENPLILKTNYLMYCQEELGYGDKELLGLGVVHLKDGISLEPPFYPLTEQWLLTAESAVDPYTGGERIYLEMPQYVAENDLFLELKLFPFLRPDSIVTKIGQFELFDASNMPLSQNQIDYNIKKEVAVEGSFYFNYETY